MKKSLLLFSIVLSLLVLSLNAHAQEWRDVTPDDAVELPKDLFFQKEYRIQWWYFTGHLYDSRGREFGYEVTFFAAGVQHRKYASRFRVNFLYLSHFAISDVQEKKYYHFSSADAGAYGFAGAESKKLKVWVGRDSLEGTMKKMHIKAEAKDIQLDLFLLPKKPVVLNGEKGYLRKSEESDRIASRYFSYTDLQTTGALKVRNDVFQVAGKSWFDREISTRGLAQNEGWDWFSLQLDDGREIMLYRIRKKDGSIDQFSSGTLVYRDGRYRRLDREDYAIAVLSSYRSKHTGTVYPSKWKITIPSEKLELIVTPLIGDQEFTGIDIMGGSYWEGTCKTEGSAQGRAYVEMTGY